MVIHIKHHNIFASGNNHIKLLTVITSVSFLQMAWDSSGGNHSLEKGTQLPGPSGSATWNKMPHLVKMPFLKCGVLDLTEQKPPKNRPQLGALGSRVMP